MCPAVVANLCRYYGGKYPIEFSPITYRREEVPETNLKPSVSLVELTLMFVQHKQGHVSEEELKLLFQKYQDRHFQPPEFSSVPPSPSKVCRPKSRKPHNLLDASMLVSRLRSCDPLLNVISEVSTEQSENGESSDGDAPTF